MFNKNHRVSDSPLDAPDDREEYMKHMRDTFCAVLHAARMCKATTAVIPDAGCGVFKNEAEDVGQALGEAIMLNSEGISDILITGRRDFYDAVMGVVSPASATRNFSSSDLQGSPSHKREAAVAIQTHFRGREMRKGYPSDAAHKAWIAEAGGIDMERIPCKYGCGMAAAPGHTRSGRKYDTCCRLCAKSHGRSGEHDSRCPGPM